MLYPHLAPVQPQYRLNAQTGYARSSSATGRVFEDLSVPRYPRQSRSEVDDPGDGCATRPTSALWRYQTPDTRCVRQNAHADLASNGKRWSRPPYRVRRTSDTRRVRAEPACSLRVTHRRRVEEMGGIFARAYRSEHS